MAGMDAAKARWMDMLCHQGKGNLCPWYHTTRSVCPYGKVPHMACMPGFTPDSLAIRGHGWECCASCNVAVEAACACVCQRVLRQGTSRPHSLAHA